MNQYQKDLHAVLGVDEKAGPEELRRAYLALAVKYHPDRNPGNARAEERFKDISQAYAILSDPEARAQYERLRAKARPTAGPGAASAGPKPSSARGPRPAPGGASAKAGPTGGQEKAGSAGGQEKAGPAGGQEKAGPAGGQEKAGPAGGSEAPEPDVDEILDGFFKSAKGRDTLRDLEEEMRKAGVNFKKDDLAGWFKSRRRTAAADPRPPRESFFQRLGARLPGAAARARKKAEAHEIHYRLSLSPQAAAAGTTVEISYLRDDQLHQLKVQIPAGAQDGDRLRLPGEGRLKPDENGARGDLILTILVGSGQSVADLWK